MGSVLKYVAQLPAIFQIVQIVTSLVMEAEKLFRGRGRGPEKKAFVLDAVGQGLEFAELVGVREVADDTAKTQVLQAAEKLIDATVASYNLRKLFRKGEPPPAAVEGAPA